MIERMTRPHRMDVPRRTKIVATLGPASFDERVLTQMIEAGVDVCRVNCSHSDHDAIRRQVALVRRVSRTLGKPVALLLDLQGPKVRVGRLREPLDLATGDLLTVVMSGEEERADGRVGTTYPQMADDVAPGDEVLFDDGALAGVVERVDREVTPAEVHVRMTEGGLLWSHKGMNLPGVEMSTPSLTEKDVADLAVGLDAGVDYVALSFVRRARDVVALRRLLDDGGRDLPIIAKIEKPQALEHLDEILQVAEGVMVARGDLGVEVALEKVPVFQKEIIDKAYSAGAIIITATQMLDSMIRNLRPTRAEVTDVANAILDGTDAVMLSGETATGIHPVAAVETMDRIARDVEQSRFVRAPALDEVPVPPGAAGTLIRSAIYAATKERCPLVVFTWSGASAATASKGRPPGPLFALTPDPLVVDRLALVWGVTPMRIPVVQSVDDLIAAGEEALLASGALHGWEVVVILAGRSPMRRATYLLKISEIGADTGGD
ncbi:MAG: pyruvate kinase [Deltaproteobacteria bacterium]|nr:pyruvate kinase [Deltaproteobacteria bacterium]MBW2255027.1 pyruvate kinase [Deltaproteobacteria bacterium]